MYFFVDLLLLLGVDQLLGVSFGIGRGILAALSGSISVWICLLANANFVSSAWWRFASLAITALIGYGWQQPIKCLVYGILHISVSWLLQQTRSQSIPGILLFGGVLVFGILLLCGKNYIPVELTYGDRKILVTALRDTGNTLRDPVTGKPVLIVDANAAENLTGLTREQLRHPMETIGVVPGLRLIPYRTIGNSGLLLALRLQNVRIGMWRGSGIVAFAPEILSAEGSYQALTGGTL